MDDDGDNNPLVEFQKMLRPHIRGMETLVARTGPSAMTKSLKGQLLAQSRCCFICGHHPARRWINYNKPNGRSSVL